jgi:hypothetical protein
MGSFRKNIAAGSHRFGFGDFRSHTPGPPPFSSMNSTSTASKAGPVKFRDVGYERTRKVWVRFAKQVESGGAAQVAYEERGLRPGYLATGAAIECRRIVNV